MTPMVDLGFLLITFFVMTASLSEPRTTSLFVPADGPGSDAAESASVTILLGNDRVWYYEGLLEKAIGENRVHETNFDPRTGIGAKLRNKQVRLGARRNELIYLIKSGQYASYGDVVNALDEAQINRVRRYSLVKLTEGEKQFLSAHE